MSGAEGVLSTPAAEVAGDFDPPRKWVVAGDFDPPRRWVVAGFIALRHPRIDLRLPHIVPPPLFTGPLRLMAATIL